MRRAERLEFVALLRNHAFIIDLSASELSTVVPSCRDPKDNIFLALAAAAGAQVIVSSDQDLLILDPWRGSRIISPAEFLTWYDQR